MGNFALCGAYYNIYKIFYIYIFIDGFKLSIRDARDTFLKINENKV